MDIVERFKREWDDGSAHTPAEYDERRRVLRDEINKIRAEKKNKQNIKEATEDRGYPSNITYKSLYELDLAARELAYWSRNITQTPTEREAGLRKEVQELYYDDNWIALMEDEYKYWMKLLDARPGAAAHPRFVTAKLSPALRTLARAVDVMLTVNAGVRSAGLDRAASGRGKDSLR
jgi:hypothetical protein